LGSILRYDNRYLSSHNTNSQYRTIPILSIPIPINTSIWRDHQCHQYQHLNTNSPAQYPILNTNTRCQYWCWYMPNYDRFTLFLVLVTIAYIQCIPTPNSNISMGKNYEEQSVHSIGIVNYCPSISVTWFCFLARPNMEIYYKWLAFFKSSTSTATLNFTDQPTINMSVPWNSCFVHYLFAMNFYLIETSLS